jgi:hypothetical protein
MHTDSIFNGLGLVEKLATSSRISHRETPKSNNNKGWKVWKGLSSLKRCDQFTQLKDTLDSGTLYPITQCSKKYIETDKRKP